LVENSDYESVTKEKGLRYGEQFFAVGVGTIFKMTLFGAAFAES